MTMTKDEALKLALSTLDEVRQETFRFQGEEHMTDNTIEFRTTHNEAPKWVMKITEDRRIEVAEDVEVTEAAKKVLEAMQWMLDGQKRTWVGLTDEERQDIALEVPIDAVSITEAKLREKNT